MTTIVGTQRPRNMPSSTEETAEGMAATSTLEEIRRLQERVRELKRQRNAIILAHNYQRPEVQDVADFVGDSLELSRRATTAEGSLIVFCGVNFMAESAAILNPTRPVLLVERTAGCPMANMIEVEDLREWKARFPGVPVVCYVNSSAAVKAESDVCCTSANALKVVESLASSRVLFVPDQHLGAWVASQTKKEIILYPGFCPTHQRVRPEHVRAAKEAHPQALVLAHPECDAGVTALADAVLSTAGMLRYARQSSAREFLIATEAGLLHRLQLENPDKVFYTASNALLCPNMKKTSLEGVVQSLEQDRYVVSLPEEVRLQARRALDRMLELV